MLEEFDQPSRTKIKRDSQQVARHLIHEQHIMEKAGLRRCRGLLPAQFSTFGILHWVALLEAETLSRRIPPERVRFTSHEVS